jgi:hypothetical protein
MLKHLQSEIEEAPGPRPSVVLLEACLLTLLLPALGLWRHPDDPFFLHASFPWLVLAPLFIGLLYGFAHGLGSAVLLNLLMLAVFQLGRSGQLGRLGYPGHLDGMELPTSLALGLVLTAMVAGEFCDMWQRKLHRMMELNYHHHTLMQRFARAYHLLSISHERLERRVLANTKSLREVMTYLRERALSTESDSPDNLELHHLMMEVLGSFGLLQVAAMYRVDEHGILIPQVTSKLGNPKPIELADPLLAEAFRSKQFACIRPEAMADPGENGTARTSRTLLGVLPLSDVHGRIWGVVTVQVMPFEAFNEDHLSLLAVLGGHLGDMLALAGGGAVYQFHSSLLRSHKDASEHNLSATLVGIVSDPALAPPALWSAILERHRAIDQQWLLRNRHGHRVLFVVMPLTTAEGARGFVQRLSELCQDRCTKSLGEAGVRIHQIPLDGTGTAKDKLRALKEACEVHGD